MRGPRGERLGDPTGDDPPFGPALTVVDAEGVERPGYTLRAGDFITATNYDHDRRHLTATVGERPLTLRVRLRRWWEGWRR
jgi:hypothetical protein